MFEPVWRKEISGFEGPIFDLSARRIERLYVLYRTRYDDNFFRAMTGFTCLDIEVSFPSRGLMDEYDELNWVITVRLPRGSCILIAFAEPDSKVWYDPRLRIERVVGAYASPTTNADNYRVVMAELARTFERFAIGNTIARIAK